MGKIWSLHFKSMRHHVIPDFQILFFKREVMATGAGLLLSSHVGQQIETIPLRQDPDPRGRLAFLGHSQGPNWHERTTKACSECVKPVPIKYNEQVRLSEGVLPSRGRLGYWGQFWLTLGSGPTAGSTGPQMLHSLQYQDSPTQVLQDLWMSRQQSHQWQICFKWSEPRTSFHFTCTVFFPITFKYTEFSRTAITMLIERRLVSFELRIVHHFGGLFFFCCATGLPGNSQLFTILENPVTYGHAGLVAFKSPSPHAESGCIHAAVLMKSKATATLFSFPWGCAQAFTYWNKCAYIGCIISLLFLLHTKVGALWISGMIMSRQFILSRQISLSQMG